MKYYSSKSVDMRYLCCVFPPFMNQKLTFIFGEVCDKGEVCNMYRNLYIPRNNNVYKFIQILTNSYGFLKVVKNRPH